MASAECDPQAPPRVRSRVDSFRLLDFVRLVHRRFLDGLNFSRGPADHGFFDVRIPAQPEMQPPFILGRESTATGNFLSLLLPIPKQSNLRADCAAIAL